MLPTPQMVHCARFFYGPMLQGRDGIGAAPCCGTGALACGARAAGPSARPHEHAPSSSGLASRIALRAGVVFRRDVLVSIGGQSYGSITEVGGCAPRGRPL